MPLNGENFPIENVANPAREDHAANKRYVDDKIASLKNVVWATAFSAVFGFAQAKTAMSIEASSHGCSIYFSGTSGREIGKIWRIVGINPFAYNPEFSCLVEYYGLAPSYGFIGVGFLGDGTGDPDFTKPHFGFKFDNATTDYVALYATNANGTSQTYTDFRLDQGPTGHYLRAVMSSDNIKFYRNGELVATHTTNLPTAPVGDNVIFYMMGYRTSTGVIDFSASSFIYLINK